METIDGVVLAKMLSRAKSARAGGEHHKDWAIDQMVRALTGPGYEGWVRDHNNGEDGPEALARARARVRRWGLG